METPKPLGGGGWYEGNHYLKSKKEQSATEKEAPRNEQNPSASSMANLGGIFSGAQGYESQIEGSPEESWRRKSPSNGSEQHVLGVERDQGKERVLREGRLTKWVTHYRCSCLCASSPPPAAKKGRILVIWNYCHHSRLQRYVGKRLFPGED